MIDVVESKKCCGCNACEQVCPKHCINKVVDSEGFVYPVVDSERCIDCHLCEKTCPMLSVSLPILPKSVEAMRFNNTEKRIDSSSGGVFTAIAEEIISRGGVVFGASFDDELNLVHSFTDNIEGIQKYRGSKYVQSDTKDAFLEVKHLLDSGRWVLFSGTPCQVKGLLLFLRKPYEKLLAIDFICHGVPSHNVLMAFVNNEIDNFAKKHNKDATLFVPKSIRFRDKSFGWKKYSLSISIAEKTSTGHKTHTLLLPNNAFNKGFGANLFLRPSCHNCPAKNFTSGSDITLADYWRVEAYHPEMDDDKGTSLVAINSDKAMSIVNHIASLERKQVDAKQAYKSQPALFNSMPIPNERSEFWNSDWQNDFINVVNRIADRKTIKQKVVETTKAFLRKIGLKKLLSKFFIRYR